MWIYVLYMGFLLALDPFRLGFALVLVSRQRPMLNLFAFWLGGMAAGVGLAMFALLLLRDFTQVVVQNAMSVINHVRSTVAIFSGGRFQITVGVLLLLALVIVKARQRARVQEQVAVGTGGVSDLVRQPRGPGTLLGWFAARTHDMLKSDFIWPVFVAGLASAIPPIDGVVMLTVIIASRADPGTQFSAFVAFTLLMLLIVEIPLVGYMVRPEKTVGLLQQAQNWVQAHLRQILHTLLAMGGITAVVQGVASL